MAVYTNLSPKSPISSVEFSPVSEGNVAFFHLKPDADTQALKQWLAKDLGQHIEAETKMGKEIILVTRGEKGKSDVIKGLDGHGEHLQAPPEPKHHMDNWQKRGILSMIGHPLTLLSSYWKTGGMDPASAGFAISNLLANLTNYFFGAEKRTDPHHLRFIKEKVNTLLAPYVQEGTKLPDPADKRDSLRKEPEGRKPLGQRFHDFMKRHSVMVGEIGLRYLGGVSLVLPFMQELGIHGEHIKVDGEPLNIKENQKLTFDKGGFDRPSTLRIVTLDEKGKEIPGSEEIRTGWKTLETDTQIGGRRVSGKRIDGHDVEIGGKETALKWQKFEVISNKNGAKFAFDGNPVRSTSHWAAGFKNLSKGKLSEALHSVKNTDKFTLYAGSAWLTGKTIAFFSKVPDPYNPDKPDKDSWRGRLDRIREKYLFKISTVTEALGASTVAYDRLVSRTVNMPKSKLIPTHFPTWDFIPKTFPKLEFLPKALQPKNAGAPLRGMEIRGAKVPDFIGSIGGILFAAAFVMRFNAPFGVREVNMEEVNAHVADGLALVSPDKLPQATAEAAAFLSEHLKNQKVGFADEYTKLTNELYRYHNIALPGADGGQGAAAQPEAAASKPFAKPGLRKPDMALVLRPGSFQDMTAVTKGAALGVSA